MGRMHPKVITVTDSISPTSMPYNEFVLYFHDHWHDDQQKLIILFEKTINTKVVYPDDLSILRCGTDIKTLRRSVKEITAECENKNQTAVFHIHEGKSVLFFHTATLGQYRKQIVYSIHSTFANYAFHNKLFTSLASFLSRKVVCVSRTSYNHYPAILKRILGNRVMWIQNGVDCDRINRALESAAERTSPRTEKNLRMIYVARLIPLKRHELLLEAMKYMPGCELTLIGQGTRKKPLQELAKAYGISDRIHFAGILPRDEVFVQIKAHDVYISSSSYEGLPISLLEAMSCGVVCAVSDIEQHREIQEKCPSLITVKNTVEDWIKAIQRIAAMSAEERIKIGNQNKKD
nr:glycosyltransferase [Butyrivibrio sp.]